MTFRGKTLLAVLLALLCAPLAQAATIDQACESDIPAYEYRYSNPLYGTLAGYFSIKDIKLKNQRKIDLAVPSFRKKFPVKAIVQNQSAPLVVVLLGVDGRSDSPLGKLWVSWFADAGCHVLTFDSTFLPAFSEASGHGVAGNLAAEAQKVSEIIATFLKTSELNGKVSKIGVVGMSYGGIEALLLGQMAKQGKLPFALSGVQAYSPPIKMHRTGELIDRWHAEDRWDYKLTELATEMSGHKPVASDADIPFDDSKMRAAIAAVFRLNLADLIVRNDRMYKMKVLPSGDEFSNDDVKRDHASTWGYTKFMTDLSFKYWERNGVTTLADLVGPAELSNLLKNQPACSETILSEDDPFNRTEDMLELKKIGSDNLTILPRGGHLGFVNEPWTKAKLLNLFNKKHRESALSERAIPVSVRTK
jgi:predicted alpha/beta-fold hydrolase